MTWASWSSWVRQENPSASTSVSCAALRTAGCAVREDGEFEGSARAYVDDPFGNRIELISDR